MNIIQKELTFGSVEKARKLFQKHKNILRVLVLNQQGLPVLQLSNLDEFSRIVDEEECAMGAELTRKVFDIIKVFRGREPFRIAFFFNDEVITVDRKGPFIFIVTWPESALKAASSSESFIKRLQATLAEDLA